jgi:hypothetical protein
VFIPPNGDLIASVSTFDESNEVKPGSFREFEPLEVDSVPCDKFAVFIIVFNCDESKELGQSPVVDSNEE